MHTTLDRIRGVMRARLGIRPVHLVAAAVAVGFYVIWLALYAVPDLPYVHIVELLYALLAVLLAGLLAILGLVAVVLVVFGLFDQSLAALGRRARAVALVCAVGLVAFVLAFAAFQTAFDGLTPSYYARAFDRTAWLEAADDAHFAPRQQMLADVVDDLAGNSRAQVVGRLGPDNGWTSDDDSCLIYWLGPTFFPGEQEYLHIYFDASGGFVRWELHAS